MNIQQKNSKAKVDSPKQLIKWIILWKELSGEKKTKDNKSQQQDGKWGYTTDFVDNREKITIFPTDNEITDLSNDYL